MNPSVFHCLKRAATLAALALLPVALAAQAPAPGMGRSGGSSAPKWDIFLGYSYLSPHGTVDVPQPTSPATVEPFSYDAINLGGAFSGAYFFNRYLGIQAEFDIHQWGQQSTNGSNIGTHGNDDGFNTVAGGVVFQFPTEHFTPFVHVLGGASQVGGPDFNPNTWGPNVTAGGGLDAETPWFNHRMAIRIFQADYQFMHANFGTQPYGGMASVNAAQLSAGIVFHNALNETHPVVALACTASPESVFPGDPVTVTASAGELNPKDHVIYSWSGTGVTGNGPTATVDTSALAPGEYSITGTVKEGKPGREGMKPWETATCTAGLTVKAYEPPTISCSASPATIAPGGASTITATGVSPQNRPLTYSYTATAGTVTGTGPSAEYSSAGAPTGIVGITCNVSDDKGHTGSANTSLTIVAPVAPPPPTSQALCTISFATDPKRPMRVDNEAKACLDQVALDLKQQADAKAVVVGEQTPDEAATTAKQQERATKHPRAIVDQFAAQRAVNAKDYLVTEQGIDPSRISVATGTANGQTVENYLVPSGATFTNDVQGTTPVDETAVKPQERKPLPQRH
jgi:hypothetical protein